MEKLARRCIVMLISFCMFLCCTVTMSAENNVTETGNSVETESESSNEKEEVEISEDIIVHDTDDGDSPQLMSPSEFATKSQEFISKSPWRNGDPWGTGENNGKYRTLYVPWDSWGCMAYCSDFVKYVYNQTITQSGQVYYNVNEIRAGDIVAFTLGRGHWFVVLGMDGNKIYAAEAYSDQVHIQGDRYRVTNGKLISTYNNEDKQFWKGYHYVDNGSTPTPTPTPVVTTQVTFQNNGVTTDPNDPIFKFHAEANETGKFTACGVAYRKKGSSESFRELGDSGFSYNWVDTTIYFKKEHNTTLSPGTQYEYKFYAVFKGTKYYSDAMTLTTNGILPTGVSIQNSSGTDISSLTLDNGATSQLKAKISPDNATNKTVSWTSTKPNIVAVDSSTGKLTAKSVGSSVIKVTTSNGKTDECTVTVVSHITKVTLNKHQMSLVANCNQQLTATITPDNTTDSKTLTWTSSNTSVASVNSSGVVTGNAVGTARITVKTSNGKTDYCDVTVYDTVVSDGVWMPGNVKKGEGWGLGGYIYAPTNITEAKVTVSDLSGNAVQTYTATPNSKTWLLWDANNTIKLKDLPLGTYKMRLYINTYGRQLLDYTHEFTVTNNAATHINYYNASPMITNFTVKDITSDGFTVQLTGKDRDKNLTQAKFLTWSGTSSMDDRDDTQIKYLSMSGEQDTVEWRVQIKDHNYESGPYWVDYVVYDAYGNWAWNGSPLEVPVTQAESVTLSETTKELHINDTFNLTATVLPAHAVNKAVTWTSSDTAVATVSNNGVVTAVSNGTATITASTANGKSATCIVTVSTPIVSVSLNKTVLELMPEASEQLIATILPENTSLDITLTWTSSDEAVATVDQEGNVLAIACGEAVITVATTDGKTAECDVYVINPATSLNLSTKSLDVLVGGQAFFNTIVKPDGANVQVTCTSSDESIAVAYDNGRVVGVSPGYAIVTARTSNGLSNTCMVRVYDGFSSITGSTYIPMYSGQINNSVNFSVLPHGQYPDGAITYTSSDESVATVRKGQYINVGYVEAFAAGTTLITATTSNGLSAQTVIDVKKPIEYRDAYSVLSLYQFQYPTNIKQGENPGIAGEIDSSIRDKITQITITVYDSGNNAVLSYENNNPDTYEFNVSNASTEIDFSSLSSGNYTINVYAVNESESTINFTRSFTVSGESTEIATVYNTTPIITDVYPEYLTKDGYYVYVGYKELDGTDTVSHITYGSYTSENGKDDLVTSNNNNHILTSDHGNQTGEYVTEIVVYDSEGNSSKAEVTVVISDVEEIQPEIHLSSQVLVIDSNSATYGGAPNRGKYAESIWIVDPNGHGITDLDSLTWQVSDPEIATVVPYRNGEYYVISQKPGVTTITLSTPEGISDECTVIVDESIYEIPFSSGGNSRRMCVVYGQQYYMSCYANAYGLYPTVGDLTWTSSDPSVATVENGGYGSNNNDAYGDMTIHGPGTTIITVTSTNGNSGTFILTVTRKEAGVQLNVDTVILNVGENQQLIASTTYEDEVNQNANNTKPTRSSNTKDNSQFIWSSSDPESASVDNGNVTALRTNNVVIKATTRNGSSGVCTVIVKDPIRAITLSEEELNLTVGNVVTLSAVFTPMETSDYTKLSWVSSDTKVATVDASGTVEATGAGTCTITVSTTKGITTTCTVNVTNPITSVVLSDETVTLNVGESYSLNADVLPINASGDHTVTWSVSDESVVSLEDGQITALKAGTATVTVTTSNDLTDECTITVHNPLIGFSIPEASLDLPLNETYTLEYELLPLDTDDDTTVTFVSSDPSIVSVDENGTVTANAIGTTVITASLSNGMTAQCEVRVIIPITGIMLSDESVDLIVSGTHTLSATILPADTTEDESVVYESSDTAVATVDASGNIEAIGAGTCEITVTAVSGISAVCTVNVSNPITAVILPVDHIDLNINDQYSIDASVYPLDTTDDQTLIWTVSDDSVISLENGQITALNKGDSIITVTSSNGLTAQCTVTVHDSPAEIILTSEIIYMTVNETATLEYQLLPEDAFDNKVISFISSDSEIVSIDQSGNLTANSVGIATITVSTEDGLTAECQVNVTIPIESISFAEDEITMPLYVNEQLVPIIDPESMTDLIELNWYSTNEYVAVVDTDGVVYTYNEGEADIVVEGPNSTQAICTIIAERRIQFNEEYINLNKGDQHQIEATVTIPNAELTWRSYDETVAVVDGNGVVTAVNEGTTYVVAELNDGSINYCLVTVTTNGFSINAIDSVIAGTAAQLSISDSSYQVVWSSSNEEIASVDESGLLTAKKAGVVQITATDENTGYTDSIEVRVLFTDVSDSNKYFYDPVYWAFDNGITTGTSGTKFSPNDNCTRGQVVTFLWRAVGCPEPEGDNPFSDVTEDKFFYKAVLWAYENGITTGTSSNTFSPNAKCKREQIVTFLYRTAVYANSGNAPEYTPRDMNFPDVKETNYFYDAVLWAYSTGITTGVNNNTQFGVGQNCVRGMVVTFLKRYKDAYPD